MGKTQIYDFAFKWLNKYQNVKTTDHEVVEGFADECFALGFEMDCGNSFEAAFPRTSAFNRYEQLNGIIDQIDDIELLGAAIFSRWRYITHWSYKDSLLSEENRPWFVLAFERLAFLAEADEEQSNRLRGSAKKIRISSNNICYGPAPEPEDEVEQRLTLCDDGRVWFTAYNFGLGFDGYVRGRSKQFKLDKETADRIFSAFNQFFSGEFIDIFVTDIGSWEMIMTNEEGEDFAFSGSLCADYEIDGVDLSELLRDELGIENLLVFDGDNKPNQINRVEIEYSRNTKNEIDGSLDYRNEHAENIVIDRATETIEHIQRVGTESIVTKSFQVKEGISELLDRFDADGLFEYIDGYPDDVIENTNEVKEYRITIDFKKGSQRILSGSFDKNGLPEDWSEFAEDVFSFMKFYGLGEVLDPSAYGKAKRRESDYILCSVTFEKEGKEYYYLAYDDIYEVGDLVNVPVSYDEHTSVVRIVNIEYFQKEETPFPIEKIKHILGKCN